MALCTVSQPFSLLSGKFANPVNNQGVVAMPTAQRNVIRQMVVPNNPETARQIDVRTIFAQCAEAFTQLTQTEVAGWKALADQYKRKGRLDLEYTLSAVGIFNAVNWYRLANNQAIVETAPTYDQAPTPGITELVMAGQEIDAELNTSGMTAGQLLAIRISAPLSGARVAQRGDVRFPRAQDINGYIFTVTTPGIAETFSIDVDGLGYAQGQRIGISVLPLTPTYQPGTAAFVNSIQIS